MSEKTVPLFIYGTLKQGFHNFDETRAGIVRRDKFLTVEKFPLHTTGKWHAPVLINDPGVGHNVFGEIHDVTQAQLEFFDWFESTHSPIGYDRLKIQVRPETGGPALETDVYMKPRERIDIVHGDPMPEYPRNAPYVMPQDRD